MCCSWNIAFFHTSLLFIFFSFPTHTNFTTSQYPYIWDTWYIVHLLWGVRYMILCWLFIARALFSVPVVEKHHIFSVFPSLRFSWIFRNLVYHNFNRHLFTCIQTDWDNYLVNTIKFLTASSKIFAKFHIMIFPLAMKNFRKIENHCGTLFKLAKMDVCWCYCWKKNRVSAEWEKK